MAALVVRAGHGEVAAPWSVGIRFDKRRSRNRLPSHIGRQAGCTVRVQRRRARRKHPRPIVVLAIHKRVRNNSGDDAGGIKNVAALWLAARTEKLGDAVGGAVAELGWKCKRHVARYKQVVSGVVLQLHRISGTDHQSGDIAAHGELRLWAGNLNIVYDSADRGAAIRNNAVLRRR